MLRSSLQFRVPAPHLIMATCLMGGLIAQPASALIDSAEVIVGDELPSPDGRLHLMAFGGRTSGGGSPVQVVDVRLNDGVLEIVLDSFPGPAPVITGFNLSLAVDAVPPGEYAGVVLAGSDATESDELWQVGEFAFSVADQLRLRVPMLLRFWPDSPTTLDEIWLLVEPVHTCSLVELDIPFHISSIVLDETAAACTEDELPRIRAFPLGKMEELSFTTLVRYWVNDELVNQTNLRLEVRDALTSRLAGSWYNPNQSGHGLTLEVLDAETMLAYWFTFDSFGEPFWLIAMGAHQGGGRVVLDAVMVEGGMFPPNFDPEMIERFDWGTLEIEFASCGEATLRWMPEAAGFESSEMPLVRLSKAEDNNCLDPPPASLLVPDWFNNADFYFRLDG